MTDYRSIAENMKDQLVSWRRDFHAHPELAFEEERSAGIVAEHLQALGYRVQTGIATTGVIGVLEGSKPGPVVMLRFDMDALPVTEETGAPYASTIPGRMHACGHDAHIALGMGIAELWANQRDQMTGTLKLLFQPAEETGDGAKKMIQEGALENPRPDVCITTHVWSEKPVGIVDVTPGPVMAAAEEFTCTIHGQGGHGALPHQAVDPVVAAAQIVCALQTVVSRNISPLETAVVTVGSIHAGEAFNVIPPSVEMTGTVRSYQPATREIVLTRMREIIENTAIAFGASAEFSTSALTPAVINNPQITEQVRQAAEIIVGEEQVTSGEQTMGSEDASFFMEEIPGCYFFLGAANPEKGFGAAHHNPGFDIDEDVLVIGLAILAQAAASYLVK